MLARTASVSRYLGLGSLNDPTGVATLMRDSRLWPPAFVALLYPQPQCIHNQPQHRSLPSWGQRTCWHNPFDRMSRSAACCELPCGNDPGWHRGLHPIDATARTGL